MEGQSATQSHARWHLEGRYTLLRIIELLRDWGSIPKNSEFRIARLRKYSENAGSEAARPLRNARNPHFATEEGIEIPVWNLFNITLNRRYAAYLLQNESVSRPSTFLDHVETLLGLHKLAENELTAVSNILAFDATPYESYLTLIEPSYAEQMFYALDNRALLKMAMRELVISDRTQAELYADEVVQLLPDQQGARQSGALEEVLCAGLNEVIRIYAQYLHMSLADFNEIDHRVRKIVQVEYSSNAHKAILVPRRKVDMLSWQELNKFVGLSDNVRKSREKLYQLTGQIYMSVAWLPDHLAEVERDADNVELLADRLLRSPQEFARLNANKWQHLFRRRVSDDALERALSEMVQQLRDYVALFHDEKERLDLNLNALYQLAQQQIQMPSGQLCSILLSPEAIANGVIDYNSALAQEATRLKQLLERRAKTEAELCFNPAQWTFIRSRIEPELHEHDAVAIAIMAGIKSYIKGRKLRMI